MDSSMFDMAQSVLENYSPSMAGIVDRLMEGYDGDTDSSLARSLADEARFFVYYYNTTTLVTTGALALGIGFIILSLAFYYFYYVTEDNARIADSLGRNGRREEIVSVGGNELEGALDFVGILNLLEGAFARYGVKTHECRRRIACEAHHGTLSAANPLVAAAFTHAFGYVNEGVIASVDPSYDLKELRNAADYGYNSPDCYIYAELCPQIQLANLQEG